MLWRGLKSRESHLTFQASAEEDSRSYRATACSAEPRICGVSDPGSRRTLPERAFPLACWWQGWCSAVPGIAVLSHTTMKPVLRNPADGVAWGQGKDGEAGEGARTEPPGAGGSGCTSAGSTVAAWVAASGRWRGAGTRGAQGPGNPSRCGGHIQASEKWDERWWER